MSKLPQSLLFGVGTALGLLCGFLSIPVIEKSAEFVSEIFLNLLKLVSLPIIFLSIVSTACRMDSIAEIRTLGARVFKYTLLTTVTAASIALTLFVAIKPASHPMAATDGRIDQGSMKGYVNYLVGSIPSNIVQPFSENHVIGVLFIAIFLSCAILALPSEQRKLLHSVFSGLYAAIMKMTTWITQLMPIAIWAFITLFMKDLKGGFAIESIALYLICVVGANLAQAFVVLPLLLKSKGLSPLRLARQMAPALSLAFFSKSSSAALPMAMKCAEERAGVSQKVASFSLPLCTTINMNGCAAFILITVLFVSMSHGYLYTTLEMLIWILIATIAAVGNAGVPMGCYFMASAFLAAMDVPLHILGVILPFYSLIDMLETAINVWSDSCVTAVVDSELSSTVSSPLPLERVKAAKL